MNAKDIFAALKQFSQSGNDQNAAPQRRVVGRPLVSRPALGGSSSGTRKGCACDGTRRPR